MLFVAVTLVAGAAAPLGVARPACAACESKWVMMTGDLVEVYCGPATATVHAHGKTLVFMHGTCQILSRAFDLKLGIYEEIPSDTSTSGSKVRRGVMARWAASTSVPNGTCRDRGFPSWELGSRGLDIARTGPSRGSSATEAKQAARSTVERPQHDEDLARAHPGRP